MSLADAENWNILLSVILLIAALAVIFAPEPYRNIAAVVLASGPAAAFYLARCWPLLFTAIKKKSDPRVDLYWPLMISSFGFLFSSRLSYEALVSIQYAFLTSALIATAYCCAYFITVRKRESFFFLIIPLLYYAISYGYGFTCTANIAVDDSTPSIYQTTVLDKYITYGKGHNPSDYTLRLRPWGPVNSISHVRVPAMVYGSYTPGDTVCLGLHPGLLHLQWYQLVNCPADDPQAQP